MNDKTLDLLEKNLPLVSEKLRVATEVAYDKVMWYVRVSGILGIVKWSIGAVLVLIGFSLLKKALKEVDETDELVMGWGWGLLLLFFAVALIWIPVDALMVEVTKVISPEYFVIDQIVKGLTQ